MRIGFWPNILLLATLLLNLSCSDSSSSKKSKEEQGMHNSDKTVDTTDLGICQGPTPARTTIYGSWRQNSISASGVDTTLISTIEPNAVEIKVFCKKGQLKAVATARGSASISNNSIQILSNDSQLVTAEEEGNQLICSAQIDAGLQLNYSFQGPCLKFQMGNEVRLAVPAN